MSNIQLYRGDDRTVAVTITDLAGVPLNLTNCLLQFTVKRRMKDIDTDAVITKSLGAGITVTDAPAGEAEITLDAIDTDSLPTTPRYRWDVQLVDDLGLVRTVAFGRFVLRPDITREVPGS